MSDPNQDVNRRHSDAVVIALSQRFNDFVERYDRDCGASSEWRKNVEATLKEQSKSLDEISPAYSKGKWVFALVVMGSIAIAVKSFWSHVVFIK